MCAWLIAASGGKPEDMHVAIEVPHGAVVETLLDHGFKMLFERWKFSLSSTC
jgi:hypothetical protein